ncbi:MAG: type II secretion system F family protein [Acidobacteria bacterium]|nr:type II secretion system F family protein [Acidobacteriota bacterium]MBA3888421.1 type II secretion system F family protein [Acidobacteriota bacterium]
MPTFAYSGRTRGGETVSGEHVADTMDGAVAALRREQIMVTRIDPAKAKAAAKPKKGGVSVPSKNLAIFTRQFSVMIDAGLPLVQCLEILGKQEPHKGFSGVILKVREDVEGGAALADAMKKHPKTFDSLYSNMIAAGEAGGILDTILKRLAVYIEKNVKLKGDVKSAMIYPVAVVVIAAVVVGAILWKVIPTFASLFAGLGAQLPFPTRVVIAMSDWLVAYGWLLIIGLGAAGYGVKQYYATESGRHVIDAVLLKTPILGNILRKVAVARFTRTLSTLLASGVPILDGLDITARTAGNAIIEDAIQVTRTAIERGETISAPLRETGVFPSMVVQMINVGETTGALDAMLSKIADFYEEEVDTAVAGLLTLMEPVMIAFLGGIVGGIVIAMYLPIFDLISQMT